MRAVLVLLATVCAPVATSLSVWAAIQTDAPTWYEVVNAELTRTNAAENAVNIAVSEAMAELRSDGPTTEEELQSAAYKETARAWFSSPDVFGASHERATQLVRQQLDQQGQMLRVEILRGTDMPTLIFVQHDKQGVVAEFSQCLAGRLAALGADAK